MEWLRAYVQRSGGHARLGEEPVMGVAAQAVTEAEPQESETLLEIIRKQGGEIAVLKARIAQLEEKLRRR
jgi:hypothetical protein